MDENKRKRELSIQPRKEPFKGRELTEAELEDLSKVFRKAFEQFPPFADIPDDDSDVSDVIELDPSQPFPEELDRFEAIENPTPEQIAEMKEWAKQKAQEQREAKAHREAERKDD